MKLVEKLKSKNRIPFIMFIVLFVNYIPLIRNNIATKESWGVEAKEMGICFAIELTILFLFLIGKVKIKKETIINFIVLLITTIVLTIVQFNNYNSGNYKIMDFVNVVCIFLNILFLFIFILKLDVDEKYIYNFFRAIVFMGVIACIINIILYKWEIIYLFNEEKSSAYSIKSFFSHRNQFAMFLFVSIISNMFLLLRYRKNIFYKIILLLFFANLIFTSSRTGILCVGIFCVLFFITTDRLNIWQKLITGILILEILLGISYYIVNKYPEIGYIVEHTFIRESSIKDFSGRADIWKIGTDLISQNNITKFFGIGRFRGSEILEEFLGYNQFHSFYIEALLMGGIMELAYFMIIYLTVIVKIIFSNLEKKYKSVYISMFISYFIYCGFESLSRFSIGCVDTLCIIFFISIPLLHANSIKEDGSSKRYKVPKEFLLSEKNVIFEKEKEIEE